MGNFRFFAAVSIFSTLCYCFSPAVEAAVHCGKECELVVTKETTTGGYDPAFPNLCKDKITTYAWGNCTKDKDKSFCFTHDSVIEKTEYYGWEKENAYLSVSCGIWAAGVLAGNVGAVFACGAACIVGGALTLGAACVGCLALWVAADAGLALAFESACKKDVCKRSGKTDTKKQVVCK